ncbi:tripartite tricarboxylate transporter TctB family protein [Coraliomargarita sp. SDUM461004]|uniref:Tripartite tricarboxylate transporter TctB family protein n=1 Tax=Thalassobacterium sedimentorum TaxID=3041258 RepID=A0ABU1AGL0_9BACT|nr:tripartite tricarboxylate transporter TctB family protein [Coraliomargarita sp. SDUM461004]MDQ8193308.1 tripartite tricarboxylate transporter TctB family protein [Coraliomargarita sp. SDUM461004]
MNCIQSQKLLAPALWLSCAAFAMFTSLQFPSAKGDGLGPGMLPLILALLLGGLALVDFLATRKKENSNSDSAEDQQHTGATWLLVGILILYIWLLPWLGFISSSALLSMASLRIFGYYNYVRSAAISLSLAFILYILFSLIMNVALPTGWLG